MLLALLAIGVGVFFTHRIFVTFVIALLRARHESVEDLDRHLGTGHLAWESVQIIVGITPLVWGIARLAQMA